MRVECVFPWTRNIRGGQLNVGHGIDCRGLLNPLAIEGRFKSLALEVNLPQSAPQILALQSLLFQLPLNRL